MRILVAVLLSLVSTLAIAGYDLHITRKAFWADETGSKITFAEWQAYVHSDKQVARDPENGEQDFLVSIPGQSFPLWFNASLGELYTKNPTDRAIRKLRDIARRLKAQVQGDDGELYPIQP